MILPGKCSEERLADGPVAINLHRKSCQRQKLRLLRFSDAPLPREAEMFCDFQGPQLPRTVMMLTSSVTGQPRRLIRIASGQHIAHLATWRLVAVESILFRKTQMIPGELVMTKIRGGVLRSFV